MLSLIFLIFYSSWVERYIIKKPPSTPPPLQKTHEAISQQEEISQKINLTPQQPTNLEQANIDDFIITYSSRGGYIKRLFLKSFNTDLKIQDIGYTPDDKDKTFTAHIEGNRLIFIMPEASKEFSFKNYLVTIHLQRDLLKPLILFSHQPSPDSLEERNQEFFYFSKESIERIPIRKVIEVERKVKFAGTRDRYFCLSLLPADYKIQYLKDKDKALLILEPTSEQISLYIGPQLEKNLKAVNLDAIINYGFFGTIIRHSLHLFYSLTKNWGMSIILLAIAIYILLFPLTLKSTKTMRKMQELQPELEELKKRYKDNPQKYSKEQIELFRKYKINPLGGCLPLLFQIPIFLALWQVFLRSVELKGARFLWIKDLSLPDHAFKLPYPAPFNYINILPLLLMVVSLFQQKFTSATLSTEQKSMGLFFAIFIGVIFYNMPSSLVLYWLIQNSLTTIQQTRTVHIKKA